MNAATALRTIATALLAASALTACGSDTPAGSLPTVTNEVPPAIASLESAPGKESGTASPSPVPAIDESTDEAVEAVKKYRMNEAYRFEPIAEDVSAKAVLLTFDDGPKNKQIIESILDTLDKHQAKAIFFVNGYRAKQNPELLELIHERGQTIGNHSWDHIDLKDEAEEVVRRQIGDVQNEVERLTGQMPAFFRPPYGSAGDIVRQTAKDHGMLYMTWSNGSLDWEQPARDNPREIIANVMEQLHPGANILMHELRWTADALDELLTKLEDEGYSFIDPASIDVIPYT